jgi:hypothetical protein
MTTDLAHCSEQSVTSLVNGIVQDVQQLLTQQVELARRELEEEYDKVKGAALYTALGTAFLVPGMILICLMLAHLIHWLASPAAADAASIPLWGCYALVGIPLFLLGGVLFYAGKRNAEEAHVVPPQTAKALEENLEWKTNPR